jgi:hypothetical protein
MTGWLRKILDEALRRQQGWTQPGQVLLEELDPVKDSGLVHPSRVCRSIVVEISMAQTRYFSCAVRTLYTPGPQPASSTVSPNSAPHREKYIGNRSIERGMAMGGNSVVPQGHGVFLLAHLICVRLHDVLPP